MQAPKPKGTFLTALLEPFRSHSRSNSPAPSDRARPPQRSTLVVSEGVELAYYDSGAPSHAPYTTIFAVHGMGFASRKSTSSFHKST
jgi:hypothetical protein